MIAMASTCAHGFPSCDRSRFCLLVAMAKPTLKGCRESFKRGRFPRRRRNVLGYKALNGLRNRWSELTSLSIGEAVDREEAEVEVVVGTVAEGVVEEGELDMVEVLQWSILVASSS